MTRWWLILFLLLPAAAGAEAVLPNGTTTVTNNDCTTSTAHGTMDDDPASPGGDWCNATTNADTLIKIQFASPSGDLSTSADAQRFDLYVRKDSATAPGTGTPTVALNAYDGAVLEDADEAAGTITSDTGELYQETWTSSTTDGSGIEVEIDCQEAGGGPNQRSCDFDAVRWEATLASGEQMMLIGYRKSSEPRTAK